MSPSVEMLKGIPRRLLMPPRQKVFVIGFHKTGTSSLGKALLILGYRVSGRLPKKEVIDEQFASGEYNEILTSLSDVFANYDGFQDTPWFCMYKELHQLYPDAKFILSTREEQGWIKSVKKHFGGYAKWRFHKDIYGEGESIGNEEIYLERFREHTVRVREYFSGKPNFLEINLSDGDNWNKICGFLDQPKPWGAFPTANSDKSKSAISWKLVRVIKKMLGY